MPQQSIVVQVQRARRLNDFVMEYELAASDDEALPAFEAGAHIEVRVPGVGPRHYSLVRPWCEHGPYVIAVQREDAGRGGSAWLHANLDAGTVLEIGLPRNNFALRPGTGRKVLIAGGIGITPVFSMASALDRAGCNYELVACARDASRLAYREELAQLQARGKASVVYADDHTGPLFDFSERFADLQAGDQVYCCGPASLMAHVADAAAALNSPAELFFEAFSATQKAVAVIGTFSVRCDRSDLVITVPPGKSMLDCLLAAGVEVEHSCGEGYCGTCITRHLDGAPLHLDSCLSQTERAQYVAVCVSRAMDGAEIVLDL